MSEFVGKHSGAEHITPYVTDEGWMVPISDVSRSDGARARNKFGAPMFEPKVFREKMYCIKESTCNIVGTFWCPGHCDPCPSRNVPRSNIRIRTLEKVRKPPSNHHWDQQYSQMWNSTNNARSSELDWIHCTIVSFHYHQVAYGHVKLVILYTHSVKSLTSDNIRPFCFGEREIIAHSGRHLPFRHPPKTRNLTIAKNLAQRTGPAGASSLRSVNCDDLKKCRRCRTSCRNKISSCLQQQW